MEGYVYNHYKGGKYIVLLEGVHDSNDPEKTVIIYQSITDHKMWMRSTEEFNEVVRWPDGSLRSRFHPLKPPYVTLTETEEEPPT